MSRLVSVIVPCYNSAATIVRTLASAWGAQPGEELEVIAIDDGSTDQTSALIQTHFPRTRLTRTENRGVSAARNLGKSQAQGDFIQFLDADDLLEPGKLKLQREALQAAEADAAYGDYLTFRQGTDGLDEIVETKTMHLEPDAELALLRGYWAPPAAWLLRRSLVEQLPDFHPRLPILQDARYMQDAAMMQAKMTRCEGVMARYRLGSGSSLSTSNHARFQMDMLRNAGELHDLLLQRGRLDNERLELLSEAVFNVLYNSSENQSEVYVAAEALLNRIRPGYIPPTPRLRALLLRSLGLRRGLPIAHALRRTPLNQALSRLR
jgi:glycosyltransferase involved in cell wall biosynthesis